MVNRTTINDVPIDYECTSLTPEDVEKIKLDPTKEIYDYTFDSHEVLTA